MAGARKIRMDIVVYNIFISDEQSPIFAPRCFLVVFFFFVLPSGVHLKKEANKFERKVKWLLKSYLHDFRVRASFVRVRCA